MAQPYITTNYKDLSAYEGHEVQIIRWIWDIEEMHQPPDRARILKDYPRTVLFELEFRDGEWNINKKPRTFRKMVTKAALATGDVLIKLKETGERLTGQKITEFKTSAEEIEIWTNLMKL